MNHGRVASSANVRQAESDADGQAVQHDLDDGTQELRISADIYAHRSETRRAQKRGDWWIAISLYLLLASLALVIF